MFGNGPTMVWNYPEVPTYNPLGGAGDVHVYVVDDGVASLMPYEQPSGISVAPDFWDEILDFDWPFL